MPNRGPAAGPVIITFKGLQPLIKNVMSLQAGLDDIDMTAAVRGAGKVWQENFKAEGWLATKGWKPLSEFTQNMRSWRGYSSQHPILHQSGGLVKVAADYPATMQKGQRSMRRTTGPTPSSDGTPTTVAIRLTRNRAILTLTGSKVVNNFGGEDTGWGWTGVNTYSVPARRFWFVSAEVQSQVQESVMEYVTELMSKLI